MAAAAIPQPSCATTSPRRASGTFAAALAQPATTNIAGCRWSFYPIANGMLQPEQPFFDDPDDTPIGSLTVGRFFKGNATSGGTLASTGSADFNADNVTDVFRTTLRPDGFLQWAYASRDGSGWQNLAYAGTNLPAPVLAFGDLDGDATTDPFGAAFDFDGQKSDWVYSPDGVDNFVLLRSAATPFFVALGDFNGDGKTDVFATDPAPQGAYRWVYYPSQNGVLADPVDARLDTTYPVDLHYGDFDGDGKTDVFNATRLADGSSQWRYSSGAVADYRPLATSTVPYAELRFGDVDGDGTTDVFAALPLSDGGLDIVYWTAGLGPQASLGHIALPAPSLRVGDFNGDGIADLLALRCGMPGPLSFGALQILASSGYGNFGVPLLGDVNGDGRPDLILFTGCRDSTCTALHLQMGAALAMSDRTYRFVAPALLDGGEGDFEGYTPLTGDFDGDGKTDVAFAEAFSTALYIYVAHSNGDGTFTLRPPQTFPGDWGGVNFLVGDFNGDHKADIALSLVCAVAQNRGVIFACTSNQNACRAGDANRLSIATSTGTGFTIGGGQDLGSANGWASYVVFSGDVNGDGKTDLVFNSTCQKASSTDSTCTDGDANIVYTAMSNGSGGFSLGARQTFSSSGWSDYHPGCDLVADVNGDGRTDLILHSDDQQTAQTQNHLVVAALGNPDGTFQLGSLQDFGDAWNGTPVLADVNRDHKADLVWNAPPRFTDDVDTYVVATSNGDGTFSAQPPGAVYTGQGLFSVPVASGSQVVPTDLTLASFYQRTLSDALIVVSGGAAPAAACIGDCNRDRSVTINELILGVSIALGTQPATACSAFANAQNVVDIAQLVTAVRNALNGC